MDISKLEETAATCELCSLSKGRINPVFAKGNVQSKFMICGMVPADAENKTGIPFVGRSGKILDALLEASGFSLNDVYITNLVKCYLKAGKSLRDEWVDSCLPYLLVQMHLIKPLVIVTLGADASNSLLGRRLGTPIGGVRSIFFDYGENVKIMPTYHPSYIARMGGVGSKCFNVVLEDFKLAKECYISSLTN